MDKKSTKPAPSVVGNRQAEPAHSIDNRLSELHSELCSVMSLINVTGTALGAMEIDLAEPQEVLHGASDRISAAMEELEEFQRLSVGFVQRAHAVSYGTHGWVFYPTAGREQLGDLRHYRARRAVVLVPSDREMVESGLLMSLANSFGVSR